MDTLDSSPTVTTEAVATPAPASNPAPTPAPEQTTTPPTQDASAQSSGADKGESKESLLDAVMKSVTPTEDAAKVADPSKGQPPGSDTAPSAEADAEAGATDEELPEEPTQEELRGYHSKTRKRISKLLEQRNAARAEVQTFKADAEVAVGLRTFLKDTGIQREDFSVLLDLGAALQRADWDTFLAGVMPYVELAQEATGRRLPADLQQAVSQGHMTTEAAQAYAKQRMDAAVANAAAQRNAQALQTQQRSWEQERAAQNAEAIRVSVATAVSQWEASVRQTDPDWGHKQDLVKTCLWDVINERGGRAPQSPAEALEVAKAAYEKANGIVRRFAPAPRPTPQVPSAVHRATGVTPEPKSFAEAVALGLERSRRSA